MKTLHFSLFPYRYNNEFDPEWVELALVDDDGNRIVWDSVRTNAWRHNEHDYRDYWKRVLISRVYHKLSNYAWCGEYSIDDAIYDEWYRWYFFIDGEDAREFIVSCGGTQHTQNIQAMCGVTCGWKYFKVLKEHGFRTSTAAMLAYSRGYLAGMEISRPFDHEGNEALSCLGLTTIVGSSLTE